MHVSKCSRERALALYAIAKEIRMNVRAIINATILPAANINNVALPFPSLLIELFEKARTNTMDNSKRERTKRDLQERQLGENLKPLNDIQAQLSYDHQWHLEHAEYEASYFNTMEKMFQHFGFSSGRDITGFPHMPPFPDRLH
ncbi:hypothetical protein TIFTF001_029794 [Ficus carica]|uniref:Uncharacterized protein n=1 Tax=Ficus carica TaxID=3494 RepID=A0AA88DS96_FICCA|nr:hypothetical protein TIFTF001_029794 [Ficus carica]